MSVITNNQAKSSLINDLWNTLRNYSTLLYMFSGPMPATLSTTPDGAPEGSTVGIDLTNQLGVLTLDNFTQANNIITSMPLNNPNAIATGTISYCVTGTLINQFSPAFSVYTMGCDDVGIEDSGKILQFRTLDLVVGQPIDFVGLSLTI